MPIQVNIWLLLFGCLQGLLLSLVLIKKKTYREGYVFLIVYLLVMIAQIFFKVADKHWLMEESRRTYFLSYKFPFLYGPLIWLFSRRLFKQVKTFSVFDLLHFFPFVYSAIVLNIDLYFIEATWLHWPMEVLPAFVLQAISLVVYHSLAYRLWQEHNQSMRKTFSDIHIFQTQWLRRFIVLSLAVCSAVSLLTYFIYVWYPNHNWVRFGFVLLCFFIYWVSYSALKQPALFTAFVDKNNRSNEKPLPVLPAFVVHRPAKKYAHSSLNDEEALKIMKGLSVLMEDEKIFTAADLTIETLAKRLHCNRYLLSQVLNDRLGQNFYEYINGWRIEAAKEMLLHPGFVHYKIASVGYEAGFNTLSTFNDVFKRRTGLSPSQYKKQVVDGENKRRV